MDGFPETLRTTIHRKEVLHELTAKIEKAGIKILPDEEWRKTPGKPGLKATIEAAKLEKQNYQYTVTIEATTSEADNSAPGSEKSKTIWSIYEMGGGDVSDIRTNINKITDVFLKARSGG